VSSYEETHYHCDRCGNRLPTFKNSLSIMTESSKRIYVGIECATGMRDGPFRRNADVCQECAVKLLEHALVAVKAGIRATKGTESSYEERWHPKPKKVG
jgi:DNA-directed RNA polymerase subunit RPC12/RpoP